MIHENILIFNISLMFMQTAGLQTDQLCCRIVNNAKNDPYSLPHSEAYK